MHDNLLIEFIRPLLRSSCIALQVRTLLQDVSMWPFVWRGAKSHHGSKCISRARTKSVISINKNECICFDSPRGARHEINEAPPSSHATQSLFVPSHHLAASSVHAGSPWKVVHADRALSRLRWNSLTSKLERVDVGKQDNLAGSATVELSEPDWRTTCVAYMGDTTIWNNACACYKI